MQHVANKLWGGWGREVLLTLQNKKKWKQKRNCKFGDIMLLRQEADYSQWPMTRIRNVYSESKGDVHSVMLLLGFFDISNNR